MVHVLTQLENRINEIDTRSLVNTVVKKTVTKIIPGGSKLSPVSQMSETLAVNSASARYCTILPLSKPILSGQGETRREEKNVTFSNDFVEWKIRRS